MGGSGGVYVTAGAEAVVGAQVDERGRHLLARRHAVVLGLAVVDGRQRRGVCRLDDPGLCREVVDQDARAAAATAASADAPSGASMSTANGS